MATENMQNEAALGGHAPQRRAMSILCLAFGHKWGSRFFLATEPCSHILCAECTRCGYRGPDRNPWWKALRLHYRHVVLRRLRQSLRKRMGPSEH